VAEMAYTIDLAVVREVVDRGASKHPN
jgi:hypothetical protein